MAAVVPLRAPLEPTARVAPGDLVGLARSRAPDDRQRLLLGVAALCDVSRPAAELAPLLSEIFLTLAGQAEREVRQVLAERLAGVDWAPPALMHMLALDEIEIARPVITASPLLQDADLLRILVEATLEHQIAVARRPHLSEAVVEAIVERGEAVTMTALAANRTARIDESAMRRLVDQSRRVAGLRAPLSRHPRLNEALAQQLYQWVGQALRQSIGERFRIDDRLLDRAVQDAADVAAHGASWRAVPVAKAAERERMEMERKLVGKLQAAGQLGPGLLIRALREQRLGLFEAGLAALGGFPPGHVRAALHAATAEPLYLACVAVGVDKAVFGSLLTGVRKLNEHLPGDGGWRPVAITADDADRAFRQMMENPRPI